MSASAINRRLRYAWPQVLLHWLTAVIILWIMCTGAYLALFEVNPQLASAMADFNVSISLVLIPLFIVRCVVRMLIPGPPAHSAKRTEQWLAQAAHLALYGAIAAVLLTGVLIMDEDLSAFGIVQVPALFAGHPWRESWLLVHFSSLGLLFTLIAVHIAAVVKHQLSGRSVLPRMWFAGR